MSEIIRPERILYFLLPGRLVSCSYQLDIAFLFNVFVSFLVYLLQVKHQQGKELSLFVMFVEI